MTQLPETLFIRLFHGHIISPHNGDDRVPDRTFGPFPFIHQDDQGRLRLGDESRLYYMKGMIYYAGALYRDWMTFYGVPEEPLTPYEESKARPHRRKADHIYPLRHPEDRSDEN